MLYIYLHHSIRAYFGNVGEQSLPEYFSYATLFLMLRIYMLLKIKQKLLLVVDIP